MMSKTVSNNSETESVFLSEIVDGKPLKEILDKAAKYIAVAYACDHILKRNIIFEKMMARTI